MRPLRSPLLRLFQAHHYGGDYSRKVLLDAGADPASLFFVPYSVDSPYFAAAADDPARIAAARELRRALGWTEEDPVVLFIAQHNWFKGPDIAMQVFERVGAGHERARFLVVGSGRMTGDMQSFARDRLGSHRIHFAGYVPSAQTTPYYLLSDLVLCSSRYETWARMVNEAMLCPAPLPAEPRRACGRRLGRRWRDWVCGRPARRRALRWRDRPALRLALGRTAADGRGGARTGAALRLRAPHGQRPGGGATCPRADGENPGGKAMNWLRFAAKSLVHGGIEWSGWPRRLRERLRGHLVILTYHSFSDRWPRGLVNSLPVKRFERQIRFLKAHFEVVPLQSGLEYLGTGSGRGKALACHHHRRWLSRQLHPRLAHPETPRCPGNHLCGNGLHRQWATALADANSCRCLSGL